MKKSFALLLLWAMVAAGVNAEPAIAYHGKLTVTDAVSINRKMPLPIEFRLYRNAEPGETTALWGRRISVRLDADGSFYTELKDAAGTDTGRTSFKSLAEAVASVKGGSLYISLTPVGYSELLPRKQFLGVYRSEYAAIASSAERVEAPMLKADTAAVGKMEAAGNFTVSKSFVSNGGKIINTVDGSDSSVTLGKDGGKVVFSKKTDCWQNMTTFSRGTSHVCADSLLGWKYSEQWGAYVIPYPIDTFVHSASDVTCSQQFLLGNASPLW